VNPPARPDSFATGRRIRIGLFSVIFLLVAIGVVMIYSASAIFADQRYGDSMFFLKKHFTFLGIGLAVAVGAMLVDCDRLRKFAVPILIVTCVGLLAVAFFAEPIAGARRWIRLGGFQIQPSEFAKVAVIFFLAERISRQNGKLTDFKRDILPLLVGVGTVCLLILIGKDFGTTVVIGTVFLMLLFAAGMPAKFFLWLVSGAVPLLALAVIIEPYRIKRIAAFLNPWQDVQNAGFQLYQSLLALGSGGMTGVGLGHSQQKLFYLPAAHTDFIFSIVGEELGFLGAGSVIILFIAFAILGAMIISRCPHAFGQLLSLGLVSLVSLEAIINIGVSVGVLPTKGLALPFISYGGSSLVSKLLVIGLLLNISRGRREGDTLALREEKPWRREENQSKILDELNT